MSLMKQSPTTLTYVIYILSYNRSLEAAPPGTRARGQRSDPFSPHAPWVHLGLDLHKTPSYMYAV